MNNILNDKQTKELDNFIKNEIRGREIRDAVIKKLESALDTTFDNLLVLNKYTRFVDEICCVLENLDDMSEQTVAWNLADVVFNGKPFPKDLDIVSVRIEDSILNSDPNKPSGSVALDAFRHAARPTKDDWRTK